MLPTIHPVSSRRRWSALALIVTAQFMVILDVAIVNVALPSIKSDLGFSATGLQWVITAYAIFFGGTLLLGGRLADLLGRRRMFIAGLALFSASSLLSGFAWSSGSLVAFRALQGLGGALLAPAALSLLMTTFAEGRERNRALGIYGAASGSGAAAGVLLGGVLTSYFGWSWIFFINVPVGVAAIALTPFLLRDSRADLPHRHFDLAGAATVTSGLMLLVYALTRATTDGWSSPVTIGLLGAATALIAAFVAIELRSRSPLLPMRMFRSRTLSASNAAMAIVGAAAFSEFFVLTLYLQDVLHYSAVQSGVAFVAFALTVVVTSNVAQVVVGRAGIRATLSAGLLMAAVSVALLTRLPVVGRWSVLGDDPRADASLAARMVRQNGLSFFIADAEAPYQAEPNRSQQFVTAFRALEPNMPAALSSLCDANGIGLAPWANAGFDFLPQAYVNDFGLGVSPAACVRAASATFPLSRVHPTVGSYHGQKGWFAPGRYVPLLAQAGTTGFSVYPAETAMTAEGWQTYGHAIASLHIAAKPS